MFRSHFLCIALIAATASVVLAAPPQLFHNEDCTNFFWYGDFADGKAGERVDRYVDVIADAGVTTLLINTNARKTNYKSDVWEAFFDGYDPDGPDDQPFLKSVPKEAAKRYRHGVGNMLRVHKQGVDYPARMIKRARERGISPWITLRMNDCHENNNMEHPFHGTFWKENSQYWRGGSPGYYARCLDYKEQEVRDLYKALIQETLDRYDVDGVELDFMREPFVFRSGEEAKGKPILTEWMREIRKMTEAAAKKKGHPVRLSVRVPSRPETAEGMGLDAVTWAKEGLIDVLVATPAVGDAGIRDPIQAWRDRLGDAKVTLLGGIEVRYQPMPGGPASIVTPELAAGAGDGGPGARSRRRLSLQLFPKRAPRMDVGSLSEDAFVDAVARYTQGASAARGRNLSRHCGCRRIIPESTAGNGERTDVPHNPWSSAERKVDVRGSDRLRL